MIKTSVELILDELKSIRKEIKKLRTPEDDDLFTVAKIREKWGAKYNFIMELIKQNYIVPFKLGLPGDGRKKGGLRFKRSEINEALEMFRVENKPQEQSQLAVISGEELCEKIFGYRTKRRTPK